MRRTRRLEPRREVRADAAPGRVDDDEVGGGAGRHDGRRVAGHELDCATGELDGIAAAARAAATASGEVSTPTTRRPSAGEVQREAADAAVEVPHGARGQLVDPVAGLAVERGRHAGVGLEEGPWSEEQRHVADPHREEGLRR